MQVCQDEEIIVERTVPYAHWQLARIERQWRTLSEGANTLLVTTDLLDKFWGHAFMVMMYIRNRTWSHGSNGIPLFMITNNTPDLSNLMTFECPAYAHIDKSRRNQFKETTFKGIFVGYAFYSPTWIIYNPVTHRVTRIHGVVFDEEWKSTTTVLPPILTNTRDDDFNDDEIAFAPGE